MSQRCNYVRGFQEEPGAVASGRLLTFLGGAVSIADMSNDGQGNELGRRIRLARERKGWTQAELARRVKVGPRTVGGWERGETTPLNRMGALEEVLGPGVVSPAEPQVTKGRGRAEVQVMLAHFDDLSQLELLRLSRLVQDIALGVDGDD